MKKSILAILLAFVMIIGLSACSQTASPDSNSTGGGASTPSVSPSTPSSTDQPSSSIPSETGVPAPSSVNVKDLYDEFTADPDAAASKYDGDSVTATGVVIRTGADIHGTPSIELSDTEGGELYVLYVVNSFDQLDEVAVGETVTMTGNFHVFSTSEWGVVMKQGEVIQKEAITS